MVWVFADETSPELALTVKPPTVPELDDPEFIQISVMRDLPVQSHGFPLFINLTIFIFFSFGHDDVFSFNCTTEVLLAWLLVPNKLIWKFLYNCS